MSIADYYATTIAFQRHDGTLDSFGAPDYAAANWDAISGAPTKGLLAQHGTPERKRDGKDVDYHGYLLVTSYFAGLTVGDRVSIGGYYYNITSFRNPNSLNHHYEIELVRVD